MTMLNILAMVMIVMQVITLIAIKLWTRRSKDIEELVKLYKGEIVRFVNTLDSLDIQTRQVQGIKEQYINQLVEMEERENESI